MLLWQQSTKDIDDLLEQSSLRKKMLLWQQSTKDIDDLLEQSSLIMTEVRGITMRGYNYREWRQLKSSAMPMPAFLNSVTGESRAPLVPLFERMPQFDLLQHHAWKYYDIGILRYLKLYKCDRIAPQVEHQQSLKELHMAGANLKELPSWIGNLCNLESLAIVGYSLEVLPPF